jgi:hypothetical protein
MKRDRNINLNFARLGLLGLVAMLVTTACTKIIKVDLNTANAQLVIEAYVTNQPLADTVLITKSGSYFTPGNYPRVNGATVVITDNTGLIDTFVQVDSGVYATRHLTGVPGRTYTMHTFIAGKEYDAVSTMPPVVNLDSVQLYIVGNAPDTGYHIRGYFVDPGAGLNYYMLQAYYNGILQDSANNITLDNNEYTPSQLQDIRLRVPYPPIGDSVKVSLLHIDYNTYNYFNVVKSVSSAGNPISTAVPQNPPTNILGGALGYFSAYSVSSKTGYAH